MLYNIFGQRAQFISSLSNPLSRFIDHLGYIIIGFVGAYLIFFTSSTLTIGMMTTFIIYANQFTKPFIELSGLTTQIQSALAGLNRIEELVNSRMNPHILVNRYCGPSKLEEKWYLNRSIFSTMNTNL